jgi:cadmium resistance protein CadD (predicted permease)
MPELWQDIVTALILAFVTYASTNLDNLLLLSGLATGRSDRRPIAYGFVGAAVLTGTISVGFVMLSWFLAPDLIRYLGVVPIVLGMKMLIARPTEERRRAASALTAPGIALVLLANSTDTIASFGPLFAESEPVVVAGLLAGYAITAGLWLALVMRLSRSSALGARTAAALQRLTPLIMIAVGLYILADTGTDLE